MEKKLAINGGAPVRSEPLPRVYHIGKEEINAVVETMKRGPLSDFIGVAGDKFLGGVEVKKLEEAFCKKFGVAHAVSFNSATTALQAAVACFGIGPGDEVILPPYTMSASATAVLFNGAVPIFADIDDETFCIFPTSIRARITKRTKAIMAVSLFGGPAPFDEIMAIAKEHNLKVIEDNAQAAGGTYKGKFTGTIGDVGVFSFNVHKTIQAGEGGVLVTNNDEYAFRARLVRNHGESVTVGIRKYRGGPIIGSNFRMSEIHAAIANEQLKKLDFLNEKRIALAEYLTKKLRNISGITVPRVDDDTKHVYYAYPMKIDEKVLGIPRDHFVDAVIKEGFGMGRGYLPPLYLLPVFQTQNAFNQTRFPFESKYYDGKPDYRKGICPVCERVEEHELAPTAICQYPYPVEIIDQFVQAVEKVIAHKDELV